MRDLLRKTMCVTFVMFIVSSVWVLAWARSLEDLAHESYVEPSWSQQAEEPHAAEPVASAHDPSDL